jgi:hypothetical protein
LQWKDKLFQKEICNQVIVGNDTHFNDNIFKLISKNNLENKIIFLYALSIKHKEYICATYPIYKNKIVSAHHPINLETDENLLFNIDDFMNNRKIYNIGWWLRNFKTFIDFNPPNKFKKIMLVKDDFKNAFITNIFNHNDMSSIEIVYEINNDEYSKIFRNSCIFTDILDCVANNTILECIKFNCPIILRRTSSSEEYLGKNYPLFFNNKDELFLLKEEGFLLDLIIQAHIYLKGMDKMRFKIDTFNRKIKYDLDKLRIKDTKYTLTLICFLDKNDANSVKEVIENFIEFEKDNVKDLQLLLFITTSIKKEINTIKSFKTSNIEYIELSDEINVLSFINKMKNIYKYGKNDSSYYTIIKSDTILKKKFASNFVNYLDSTPVCDFAISSFSTIDKNTKHNKEYICQKELIFSEDIKYIQNIGIVWRKNINNIINFEELNSNINFWQYCIENNLNVRCISKEILYTIYQ